MPTITEPAFAPEGVGRRLRSTAHTQSVCGQQGLVKCLVLLLLTVHRMRCCSNPRRVWPWTCRP
jgi:hypothetical protein